MATQQENAIINLVINGNEAIKSFGDLNRLRAEQLRLVNSLNRNTPEYEQQRRRLEDLNAAQRAWRQEIMQGTQAQKGFFDSFKDGFKDMAGNITAATLVFKGINSIIGAVKGLWDGAEEAYDEAQRTQTQLQAALTSTGGIAGQTMKALQDYQQTLMNQTGVDDDVIAKGEEMLLTFTNIRGKIYEDALPAIVDMTAAMNGGTVSMEGIQSTSILVGKALNDPIKGMTALRKVGVSLDEQQQEQIKTLVKSNDMMGAQALILKELQKEFGGTAKAIGDSDVGALQKFNTRVDNIKESIGQWIVSGKNLAAQVLNPLLGWVEDFLSKPLSQQLHQDQRDFLAIRVELESNNTTIERRHQLIEQLKNQYPAYLSQVDSDKVKNGELLPILDKINQAFVLRIAYQKRSENLDKAVKNEADAINDTYDAKQKLLLRIGEIQQMISEDGIKFTIKGNNENEKAIYIYRNLVNSIRDQSKENKELDRVLASNKYQNMISGLNVFGNALQSAKNNVKEAREETKRLTDDLSNFKKESGYNDTIPGADMLNALAEKVKVLKAAMEGVKNGSKEYLSMSRVLQQATSELQNGMKDPSVLKKVPGTISAIDDLLKPKSGPSTADEDAARKKAEAYAKQLADMRSEYLKLAESAKKGTVDDLDAQLKVIDDKYDKVVAKLQKLAKDPKVSKEFRNDIASINGTGGLRDQEKQNLINADFTKRNSDGLQANMDSLTQGVNDVYNSASTDLANAQQSDLSGITSTDPAQIEAQRYAIKEMYAQKTFELEQSHLNDMKRIYQAFGADTSALDKKIADNTIKENQRAAEQKKAQDELYKNKKIELQDMEVNTLKQGTQLLASILDKRTGLYKAALIVDKAVAIASVIIDTNKAIAAFAASVAGLGPLGLPILASYTAAAHVQEGISIASIVAQTIGEVGNSNKYSDGGIPDGPSHSGGGMKLVGPYGQVFGEMEGGEPIIGRKAYANNKGIVDALLNSGGAPLNYERVMQATMAREERKSFAPQVTVPVASGAAIGGQGGAVDMSHFARMEKMVADLTAAIDKESKKPVVLSRRAQDIENARVAEIRDGANA